MTPYLHALRAEGLKARRSPVLWATGAGITLLPLVGGLFMYILADPDRARRMGMLGQKAQLTAGAADWPTLLGMMSQGLAIGGAILFAFATAWVFGREFADHTVRILLCLPTPRTAIVAAKATIVVVWCSLLALWVGGLTAVVGVASGLPDGSPTLFVGFLATLGRVAGLTIGLQAVTALIASVGRGYLAPMGFTFAMLALGNIAAVLGFGGGFPWSVPMLASGMAGPEVGPAWGTGDALVAITTGAGVLATLRWWQRADQPG